MAENNEKEKDENLKALTESGRKVVLLLNYAKRIAKLGTPLLEIAEKIEAEAERIKAKLAFPVNLSCDEIAAHYSPDSEDKNLAKGLLKIDLGVSVDGYVSDAAGSVDLTPENKFKEMIKVNEKALNEAIKIARAGTPVNEIGKIIHRTITEAGFSPVRNLSGHEIKRFQLHAGLTIPNYDNGNKTKLEEGQVIAIEPFVTSGVGIVQEGKLSDVYMLKEIKPIRDSAAREILRFIDENYKTLPFSGRWLVKKFGLRAKIALKFLEQMQILHRFPELVEKSKQPVSQAEHTLHIGKKVTVLTKEE